MGNSQSSYSELRRGHGITQTGWRDGGSSRARSTPRYEYVTTRPSRQQRDPIFDGNDGGYGRSGRRSGRDDGFSSHVPPRAPTPPNWDSRYYDGGSRQPTRAARRSERTRRYDDPPRYATDRRFERREFVNGDPYTPWPRYTTQTPYEARWEERFGTRSRYETRPWNETRTRHDTRTRQETAPRYTVSEYSSGRGSSGVRHSSQQIAGPFMSGGLGRGDWSIDI